MPFMLSSLLAKLQPDRNKCKMQFYKLNYLLVFRLGAEMVTFS